MGGGAHAGGGHPSAWKRGSDSACGPFFLLPRKEAQELWCLPACDGRARSTLTDSAIDARGVRWPFGLTLPHMLAQAVRNKPLQVGKACGSAACASLSRMQVPASRGLVKQKPWSMQSNMAIACIMALTFDML